MFITANLSVRFKKLQWKRSGINNFKSKRYRKRDSFVLQKPEFGLEWLRENDLESEESNIDNSRLKEVNKSSHRWNKRRITAAWFKGSARSATLRQNELLRRLQIKRDQRSQVRIKDIILTQRVACRTVNSDLKGLRQIIRDTSDTNDPNSKGHDVGSLTFTEGTPYK